MTVTTEHDRAFAVENAQEERRRLERLRMLSVMDSEAEPEFDALVRIAAAVCGKPIALISLVDDRRQWFKANVGLEGTAETPRDIAFCAHAIHQDGVMEVPDVTKDPRFAGNPLVVQDPHIRFYAGAPIIMPTGERIGTVCVIDRQPGRLTPAQAATLQDLAAVAQRILLQRERLHDLLAVGDESRYQAISSASPLGIFQADEAGALVHVNERWQELFGMERDLALGSGWRDSVHPEDAERVVTQWTHAVARGLQFDQEFRVRGPDGNGNFSVRMQARPATWGDPPRQGYVGVVIDISRRKETERQLRSANQFLERAESLSGVGGWEADLVTRKVKWTDQNCRIYDLEPGHQPGFDEHLNYFSPAARRQIKQTVEQALRSGTPWDLELPMVTAKGRPIWVRSVGRAEFENGQPARLVGALHDITVQKAAQDGLRAANALLASVVDSLPCGLSVFDADLRLIAHNRQFRILHDFPDPLFAGPVVTFESLIRYNALRGEYGAGPPEDHVREIVERARHPTTHSLQRIRTDGVVLDIRGAPLPGGGFVTTYVDVSAAKAAEVALRESEERQKRALDASRLVLWDLDIESGRLYLSENWSELMGGPARPLVTTAVELAIRVPQEDRTRMEPAMVAMLKGQVDGYDLEHRVRRDDGSIIWIRSQGRVTQRNAQGRAARATGTNQDITQRRVADDQLARAATITRATLESAADGIVVVTPDRQILLSNQRFMALWNIPSSLSGATQPQLLAHVQAQLKDPESFARRMRSLHDSREPESFDVIELVDNRVFEQYGRHMEVGGTAIGRVWSFRDITQRHRVEAEIKRARDAAEAANRAKSDFIDTVSHEIRTPLNGVLGMTRLLMEEPLAAQPRRYVELVQSSAQSLLVLINDLLDLGKIEAGRMEFERIEFSVVDLARELRELYGPRANEQRLEFAVNLGADVPAAVVGDPGRLRQVLNNLLSNAMKFTPEGRVTLDVETAAAPAGRLMLSFTVSDTGIGIPVEVREKLFQRFAQADSSTTRKYGGTGLGLAIVKQLCEQMGGCVTLQSGRQRGSAFRVELPFSPATAGSAVPPAALLATGVAPVAPRSHRILVAEDNGTNQIVVNGMLELAGYRNVSLVEDGQQALDAVAQHHFDLILMDCRMPVMDGFEAASRLRAGGCRLPIIALTANVSQAQQEKCVAAGMDGFLGKPLDAERLAQVLDRWLGRPKGVVFAKSEALERMGGDLELFGRALESFIVLAPSTLDRVRASLDRRDNAEVHRHLHSLAGSAAMVSAQLLAAMARELEELASEGRMPEVETRLGGLQSALDEFLANTRTLQDDPS